MNAFLARTQIEDHMHACMMMLLLQVKAAAAVLPFGHAVLRNKAPDNRCHAMNITYKAPMAWSGTVVM